MKFKTTKKAMKENYNTIINVGYCSISYLLHYDQPIAYSAGSAGWACDYYDIDGVIISTGYAPIGDIEPSYNTCHRYNTKAENIILTRGMDWNDKKDIVRAYLREFIREVTA